DSVQVATGGGDLDYQIGTVADGTQILEVTLRMVEPVSTASNNGPVDLPYGVTELVIDLSAAQGENGNAVYIRLSLDRNEAADENLYLNSASGWTNLSDGLDFNNLVYTESGWYLPIDSAEFVAPGVLEIYVSDGGPLDTDGEVNGSITFTSGLGTTFQNGTSGAVAWHGLLLFFIWLAVARAQAWRHRGQPGCFTKK
ncbi:MAG: hypothetical protein QG652_1254, partial [Pseudomonadota bacterium]|nr:hypothetical protein [Pseudomonadota bacterium]